jgi:hypothetical protein
MNIANLQRNLGSYYHGQIDGQMGPQTRQALSAFRQDHPGSRFPTSQSQAAGTQNPVVRQHQGESSFDAGSVTNRAASPAGASGTGTARSVKGYQDTDVNKLRDALPPQAKNLAQTFVDAGKKYNVDPAVLAGISQHETGNWTSSAFRNKNNAMGISNAHGPVHMKSVDQSIDMMAKKLSDPNGPYANANTVGQVGKIYAPANADNDPRHLNGSWISSVSRNADRFAQLTRATKVVEPTELQPAA